MAKQDKAKKLTKEELETLGSLKKASEDLIQELGKIQVTRLTLDERYEKAIEFKKTLKIKEQEAVKYLEEKYGNGSIDLENGTFTPVK